MRYVDFSNHIGHAILSTIMFTHRIIIHWRHNIWDGLQYNQFAQMAVYLNGDFWVLHYVVVHIVMLLKFSVWGP